MAARQKESEKNIETDKEQNCIPSRGTDITPARGAPHAVITNNSDHATEHKTTDFQRARTTENITGETNDTNNSNVDNSVVNDRTHSVKESIDPKYDAHNTEGNSENVNTFTGNTENHVADDISEKIITDNREENTNQDVMESYIYSDDEDDEYIDVINTGDSGEESDVEDNEENAFPVKRRLSNPVLPDTVTCLETESGCKVYVIGTAHFSLESQEDVAKTIEATQPDVIVLELCSSRVNILQLDEKTLLEEAKNITLEKLRATIKQVIHYGFDRSILLAESGLMQGVMHVLFLNMSAHVTKQLGMAPGGEFRRAFREGQKVPGCRLHLGDRPIQITLRRALSSLSWWQHLRLCWYLLTSKEPISKEDVEKCKQKDLLEEMLKEMTGEFPALSRVFVDERDIYLTHSLKVACSRFQSRHSPTGFIEPKVVVGVVGIGHVPGIKNNWDQTVNIEEILKVPPRSAVGRILKWGIKASLVGILILGCYRVYKFTTPLIF